MRATGGLGEMILAKAFGSSPPALLSPSLHEQSRCIHPGDLHFVIKLRHGIQQTDDPNPGVRNLMLLLRSKEVEEVGNTGLQHQPDQDPVMVWGGLGAVGAVPSFLPSGLQIGLMRARGRGRLGLQSRFIQQADVAEG